MTKRETFHGVPGILRPFKEFVESKGLQRGDQIAYYGVPGTCTPFIELLAFSLRSLAPEQVFIPFIEERKMKMLCMTEEVGMQARVTSARLDPKMIVIMGGLSMPNVPVKADEVKAMIARYQDAVVVGVCFMNMFAKAGWLDAIRFDCLIDAAIDPVEVTIQE
jgi:hypothetical protein